MDFDQGLSAGCHGATFRVRTGFGARAAGPVRGAVTLLLAGAVPAVASAQRSATVSRSLVFDQVTVVDVEHGKLVPNQRVVIAGNRIRAVGSARAVKLPKKAQVVDASGKYLMPGLWDMHVSPSRATRIYYPLLLAYGVTGIRNAGAPVPVDTLRLWQREILAGTRVGPPRQILAPRVYEWEDRKGPCYRRDVSGIAPDSMYIYVCAEGATTAPHLIDSLKKAGVDMILAHQPSAETYFALLAQARRVGIPFSGLPFSYENILPESDSGVRIIDEFRGNDLISECAEPSTASVERCQRVANRLRQNGTWIAMGHVARPLQISERVDLPILAYSEARGDGFVYRPGAPFHKKLAHFVEWGMTPAAALRTATLNPAKFLHGTDSLGTIAKGKLADLVLLDADPLADIANTTKIRAVVANGHYFDRAALMVEVIAACKTFPKCDPDQLLAPGR